MENEVEEQEGKKEERKKNTTKYIKLIFLKGWCGTNLLVWIWFAFSRLRPAFLF